jgi:hypothetical protein
LTPKPVRRAGRALDTNSKGRLVRLLRRWPELSSDERLCLWRTVLEPGPVDWLGLLLALDVDLDLEIDSYGTTPLILVAQQRRPASLEFARRLIERGAALDTLADQGESALSYAASQNFGSMATLLLAAGADPRADGALVAPETARCWSGPELQGLLERGLSAEERARLPAPWPARWVEDDDGDSAEWIDVPAGRGGFRWIRNPFPGWLWIGPWPPPQPPPASEPPG